MKNVLLLFLIIMPYVMFAQVPNPGFEQWAGTSPDNWFTSNNPLLPSTITQTNDSHGGSFAVRGEVKIDANNQIYVPGLISGPFGQGFEISKRYTSVSSYYKFSPVNGDALDIVVWMYKNDNYIGGGIVEVTDATSGYVKVVIPVTYLTEETPDKCAIGLATVYPDGDDPHAGTWFILDDVTLDEGVTAVDGDKDQILKNDFTLSQNYPNPFNPSTTIEFSLPKSENVSLKIYNSIGEEVATLIDGKAMETGSHKVQWNAGNVANGVYIYRIEAGNYSISKKMILLK